MGIPVQGDQRIQLAGTLAAITVGDLAEYILSKQSTPAPSNAGIDGAMTALSEAQASLAAEVSALSGHGPVSDAAATGKGG